MSASRWHRFLRYGALGWLIEVGFTGVASVLAGDRTATSRTYRWMHPIYGAAGLALDGLRPRLGPRAAVVRIVPYTAVMLGAEYASGWVLCRALGRCPWEYTRGWHVRGLVRLDFLPFWLGFAAVVDPLKGRLAARDTSAPLG